MDLASHALVTMVCQRRGHRSWLGTLGPDLPWYALYPLWLVTSGNLQTLRERREWPMPPSWVRIPHYVSHSLLALGVMCLIWPRSSVHRTARSWLLHVLADIPTHSRERMAPRPLWPLCNWSLDGFSWADGLTSLFTRMQRRARRQPNTTIDAPPNQAIL